MKRQELPPPAIENALLRFLAERADGLPTLESCLARFPGYEELVVRIYRDCERRVQELAADSAPATPPEPARELASESAEPSPFEAVDALAAAIFEPTDMRRLAPGEQLGAYRLERELGRGAQGVIWLAVDTRLGRHVALKFFHGSLLADPSALQRFEREARIVSRLDHPGICGLYEAGVLEGLPFLAARYVEGRSLASALVSAASDREAQRLWASRIAQMARALHAAHELGIVHRDVKPSNVILDAEDRPVLLDFGLAAAPLEPSLTLEGTLFGTPPYMAPEQCRGDERIDRRVDVYALGVILYQALAGRAPHGAATPRRMIEATLHAEPPDLARLRPRVPSDLVVIANTAMARDPRDRYTTAAALAEDLEHWLAGENILARPIGLLMRLVRWAARKPALALALVAFGASTSIGTAVSLRALWVARREGEARDRALEQEREARHASERDLAARDRALRAELGARLAAESISRRAHDPTGAVELALEAMRTSESANPAIASALHDALNGWRELAARALSAERVIELAFVSSEELLCLDDAGVLRRWRWRTEEVASCAAPPLRTLAVHASRGYVVGGTAEGVLHWLDAQGTPQREQRLEGAEGLCAMSFDPAGEHLVALCADRRVLCLRLEDGAVRWQRELRRLSGPEAVPPRPSARGRESSSSGTSPMVGVLPRVSFSPSGAIAVLSVYRGGCSCLRLADGEELCFDPATRAVALSDEELFTAQGSASFRARAIAPAGAERDLDRTRISRPITDLALTSSVLVVGVSDGTVELWHRAALVPFAGARSGGTPASAVRRLAVEEGAGVVATGGDDGHVRVFDLAPRGTRCEVELERKPRSAQVEPCAFLLDGTGLWHLARGGRAIFHDPSGVRAPRVIEDAAFSSALHLAASHDGRRLALLYSNAALARPLRFRNTPQSMRLRIYDAESGTSLAERALAFEATELLARADGGWILVGPRCVERCGELGEAERSWQRTSARRGPGAMLGELLVADREGARLFAQTPGRGVEALVLPEAGSEVESRVISSVAQLAWIELESGAMIHAEDGRLVVRDGAGEPSAAVDLLADEQVIDAAWVSAEEWLAWTQSKGARSRLRCFDRGARMRWSVETEEDPRAARVRGSRILTQPALAVESRYPLPLLVRTQNHIERRDSRTGALLWRLPWADDLAERLMLDPSGTWIASANPRVQMLFLRAVDPDRLARRWLARIGR